MKSHNQGKEQFSIPTAMAVFDGPVVELPSCVHPIVRVALVLAGLALGGMPFLAHFQETVPEWLRLMTWAGLGIVGFCILVAGLWRRSVVLDFAAGTVRVSVGLAARILNNNYRLSDYPELKVCARRISHNTSRDPSMGCAPEKVHLDFYLAGKRRLRMTSVSYDARDFSREMACLALERQLRNMLEERQRRTT
jgi:hypothetical protein